MTSRPGYVDLGKSLRGFRRRRGLTLEQLAEESGISLRTISDVERGVRKMPHPHTLKSLCHALNLSEEETQRVLLPLRSGHGVFLGEDLALTLPRITPDFCGRENEQKLLTGALLVDGAPVATITGPPGTGKTTLAIAVARAVADQFERVVFVELNGQQQTWLMPEEAARNILRVIAPTAPSVPDELILSQYQSVLANKRILIVGDDAENEAQVRSLLPANSESAILLTSRHSLAGLDGVTRLPLGPLTSTDSLKLLEAIIPATQRNQSDTRALARMCHDLPLALRIAGNQVAARPGATAGAVAQRLADQPDRGLRFLTAGDRSLLAAFEITYERLSVAQQLVLRRLSLAEGTHVSAHLAAVLAGLSVEETQQILDELAEFAIVVTDSTGRVRLHDFARAFARIQVEKDPGAQHAREAADKHLIEGVVSAGWWFRVFATVSATDMGVHVTPMDSFSEGYQWLYFERLEWLPALRRAYEAKNYELVVMLAGHLHWFTRLCPYAQSWDELYSWAAISAEAVGDDNHAVLNHGEVSWFLLTYRRDIQRAAQAVESSRRIVARIEDPLYQAWNGFAQARLAIEINALEQALEICTQAVKIFRRLNDPEGLSYALPLKAEILGRSGRPAEALTRLDEAQTMLTSTTQLEPHIVALAWLNVMRIKASNYRAIGEAQACIDTCTKAIVSIPFLSEHPVMRAIVTVRGKAYRDLGDEESAVRDFQAADHVIPDVDENDPLDRERLRTLKGYISL